MLKNSTRIIVIGNKKYISQKNSNKEKTIPNVGEAGDGY